MLKFCSQQNIRSQMQMVHFPRYIEKTALTVIDLNINLVKKRYAIMISFNSVNLCSKEQVTAKSTIQVRKKVQCD